jgi:hypothetical protein
MGVEDGIKILFSVWWSSTEEGAESTKKHDTQEELQRRKLTLFSRIK